jgi:hypothetical protein
MRLEKIQTDFVTAIFGDKSESAISHVIGDDNLTAKQRLNIYRGSVHGILTQSLGLNFPVCKALVGDQFFDHMCDKFIDQFPPTSPFFSEYGNLLPTFLSEFEPAKSLPYLKDTSMLEWLRHKVWHQQYPETFDFSALAEIPEEQQANLKFELKKTMHLLQSDYRIDQLWFAHQDDSDLKLEEINLHESVKLLIWKDLDGIKIITADAEIGQFWDFLDALSKQKTVAQLATEFGEALPDLLNKGIQEGWIQSFRN